MNQTSLEPHYQPLALFRIPYKRTSPGFVHEGPYMRERYLWHYIKGGGGGEYRALERVGPGKPREGG